MQKKTDLSAYRTWIEISREAIRSNCTIFRKLVETGTRVLGVIKSNAYGHGLVTMARELEEAGVDWLGVDSISEALKLREEEIAKPLLVMGYTQPENFALASKIKTSLTISSMESLKKLGTLGKRTKIHLKIDTGMHRQGFYISELPQAIKVIKKHPTIAVEGMFTHFAAAKDARDTKDTEKQIKNFQEAIGIIKKAGYKPICHAAATGGTINFPTAQFDMVRIGIGMYGLWPSEETRELFSGVLKLQPILSWKTIISELKWVEKGERIGYNYSEELTRNTLVAILPIGYWHGYWRSFSSRAQVLVRGVRCRVLGRVSMDMVTVDVTDVPKVKVGDEVVLIGKQERNRVTVDELAELAETSNYEIVTRLNPLIKKYVI